MLLAIHRSAHRSGVAYHFHMNGRHESNGLVLPTCSGNNFDEGYAESTDRTLGLGLGNRLVLAASNRKPTMYSTHLTVSLKYRRKIIMAKIGVSGYGSPIDRSSWGSLLECKPKFHRQSVH